MNLEEKMQLLSEKIQLWVIIFLGVSLTIIVGIV